MSGLYKALALSYWASCLSDCGRGREMMEKRQIVWLFILLTFCTGYIFSFSLVSEKAFERAFASSDGYKEGTMIGSVDVSLLSKQQALEKLQTETKKWQDETTINLQYKEKSIEFINDSFIFSLEKSINKAKSGSQNQLMIEVEDQTIDSLLADFGIQEENFNREAFIQEVISYPSMLEKGVHMMKLDDFMLQKLENTVISEASVSAEENSEQLDLWSGQFPTIMVAPHSQFSLLDAVEESGVKTFTSEGLSLVATAVYQAVLPTNFQIIERSISRGLPSYAKAGYEAKVDQDQNMDLVISNVTDYEYTLEFKHSDNLFSASLTGPAFLYQYKVVEKGLETFKPKNILQYDAKLELGQQVVKKKGQDGLLIKIYRETLDENGALLNQELLAEDYYPPVHAVVATSLIADIEEANQTETETETETDTAAGIEAGQTNQATTGTEQQRLTTPSGTPVPPLPWPAPSEVPQAQSNQTAGNSTGQNNEAVK